MRLLTRSDFDGLAVDGRLNNCVFTCEKSIFNRSSKVNIGSIMLSYGGGGHEGVGTCQVVYEQAEETFKDLIQKFKD